MNGPAICPHKHRILTTRTWNDESRKNFISDLKKTPWTFLEFFDDVEDMYSAWECLFKSLIDSHFPIKRKRLRKQTHPWLDNSVLRMMRTRDKAHKKAIRTGLTEDWQKYRRLRNQVTSSNRKNRKAYFKNKLQEIIGMRLHETYCFDRFYFVDNYLPYHTDREACEISVTLHISTNTHKPWHIGIKSAKGDFQLANLHAGDAMVYKGIERPHWRNPLESRHSKRRQMWHKLIGKKDDTYYHQVFFHYVMDDGHYVHYAGDTQLTSEDERQPNQYLID